MNATTQAVKDVAAAVETAVSNDLVEATMARKAKMDAMKKHGITAVKVVGLIGLGVAGTIAVEKLRSRNTPSVDSAMPLLDHTPAE